MFTGIITGVGVLRHKESPGEKRDARYVIEAAAGTAFWADMNSIVIGASINCSGCCLTVVEHEANSFSVDVSVETLGRTTLGSWSIGETINLERALRIGDELGGHLVSGHVDGVAKVTDRAQRLGSKCWKFHCTKEINRFIAQKGSVAINGVSLTVNEVDGSEFGVNIIPHTEAVTNFNMLAIGDLVNIEVDMLARYVARLREMS